MNRVKHTSQTIELAGRKIQSKLFAVGQAIVHNGRVGKVVEPNATGHPPGNVTIESSGIRFVAWANHCTEV